ncbi:MAG: glutathione-disulfide reductase [Scytolyngbya sp. HA4215-MV1]|nr:glutathione-disulfide reductase [Scytolyngbya sp. HA4215-MV1]
MTYEFDLFVIGAGSGGIAAARRAAAHGATVGIAENDRLGGTCVNRGCVPKKLMVYASRFPDVFQDAQGYGWSETHATLDWQQMISKVNAEVTRLNGVYERMLDTSNVQVIQGRAQLLDAHTIAIGDRKVTADKILIAVGAAPVRPNIPGIERALVSDALFELPKQPQRVVLLGGGYIASEFACMLHGLGTEVIQVIRKDKILRGFDEDLRTQIQTAMIQHGIRIIPNAEVTQIIQSEAGVTVTIHQDGAAELILADVVSLAALGRRPNTDYLGLENTLVEMAQGAIVVDRHHRTAETNIYAVGDCTSKIQLTPVAINEGRVLADTLFGGTPRLMHYDNIPTAIFTTPEAATVGLTEAEAIAQYGSDRIKVFQSRFRSMYYTLAGKDEKTLMKLVVDQETDKVLGAHMVGDHAAEIIQGIAISLKMGATKANFDATVGIHPSAAEEFVTMR